MPRYSNLTNQGSVSCYQNTVVQSLINIPCFVEAFKRIQTNQLTNINADTGNRRGRAAARNRWNKGKKIIVELQKIIEKQGTVKVIETKPFFKAQPRPFTQHRQYDNDEYRRSLFEYVSETLKNA